ncbi:MAG: hypothetical protein LBB83_12335 [Treponema sp.]|nr:hypothetical protein [Treponema sp.]
MNDSDNFCEKCGSAVHDINSVINDLKKEKNSRDLASKELNELREKFNKTNSEVSKLKKELTLKEQELRVKDLDVEDKVNHCQQMTNGLEKNINAVKSTRNAVIAVWVITLVLTIGIARGVYSDLEGRYRDLSAREDSLRQEYDWLSENHTKSRRWWPISITDIVVQNWDSKERVFLSEPGQDIYASQMKYFNIKIKFDSTVYGDFDFYVKLRDTYGNLFTAKNSPSGYSFHKDIYNIYRGTDQSKDLDGIPGTFSQGQWTVEIWLSGVCIAAKTITLK